MADIMKQVQRATARAMSAFQDQPKQAKPVRKGPRPAAIAQSVPNTINPITAAKLRPGTTRPNEFSVLGYYPVPAGVIHRIPAGEPMRMFVKRRQPIAQTRLARLRSPRRASSPRARASRRCLSPFTPT